MSGAHSALEPRLPIPNRTVKRGSADDSVDYPRESRSAPDSHQVKSPGLVPGLFAPSGSPKSSKRTKRIEVSNSIVLVAYKKGIG
jgi:hypothetical protein